MTVLFRIIILSALSGACYTEPTWSHLCSMVEGGPSPYDSQACVGLSDLAGQLSARSCHQKLVDFYINTRPLELHEFGFAVVTKSADLEPLHAIVANGSLSICDRIDSIIKFVQDFKPAHDYQKAHKVLDATTSGKADGEPSSAHHPVTLEKAGEPVVPDSSAAATDATTCDKADGAGEPVVPDSLAAATDATTSDKADGAGEPVVPDSSAAATDATTSGKADGKPSSADSVVLLVNEVEDVSCPHKTKRVNINEWLAEHEDDQLELDSSFCNPNHALYTQICERPGVPKKKTAINPEEITEEYVVELCLSEKEDS